MTSPLLPLRVAVCLVNSELSGAEKRFVRIVHASGLGDRRGLHLMLAERLYDSTIKVPGLRDYVKEIQAAGRLHVLSEPAWARGPARMLWRNIQVAWVCKRHRIDGIHAVLSGFGATRVTSRIGIPVLLEVTSPDHADHLVAAVPERELARACMLHAVSPSVEARLAAGLREAGRPSLAERIRMAPLPFFRPPALPGVADREPLVVYASRLIPRKNPEMFARVAKRFLAARPEWRIALLGSGPLLARVKSELAEAVAAGRATVGHEKDVRSVLERSRIFVSLIEPDNYPSQSVLEAMAAGNAIVANDSGGTDALVGPDNGARIPLDDEALLNELVRLADDPEQTAAYGLGSQSRITGALLWTAYLDHLYAVHATCFGKTAASPPRIDQ